MNSEPLLVIDRFEEGWAVLDHGGKIFQVPRQLLPPEASEGDVLKAHFVVQRAETEERAKSLKDRFEDLFK